MALSPEHPFELSPASAVPHVIYELRLTKLWSLLQPMPGVKVKVK